MTPVICYLMSMDTGWRLPTYTEWNNANTTGNWGTETSRGYANTYASVLKIHAAGFVYGLPAVALGSRGSVAMYWSSTLYNSGYD